MKAAMANQMLLGFWQQRDRTAPWGRRLIAALVLVLLGASLYIAPTRLWPLMLSVDALLGLFVLWLCMAGNLLLQNHPHAARLVPGHVRRLRQMALLAWAALSLLAAALLGWALPQPPTLPALLLGAAALLAVAMWAHRWWWLWFLPSFGAPLLASLWLRVESLRQAARAAQALWAAQPLAVLLLCLLALGWSVARMFGDGDERHRAAYAYRARLRQVAAQGGLGGKRVPIFGRPGELLSQPFERATAAWLAHVLACAQASSASVMARAEIVLHGRQHWLRQGLAVLIVLALIATCFVLALLLAGPDLRQGWTNGALGMAIGLTSMGFNPSLSLAAAPWHSRREQALLRLLPGMPLGAAQNRALARMQLRHAAVLAGLALLGVAALAWAAGKASLLCLPLAALPAHLPALLRAPARLKAPGALMASLLALGPLALGGLLMLLCEHQALPVAAVATASLGLSLALGLWRWRVVVAAPQALPAGRLS